MKKPYGLIFWICSASLLLIISCQRNGSIWDDGRTISYSKIKDSISPWGNSDDLTLAKGADTLIGPSHEDLIPLKDQDLKDYSDDLALAKGADNLISPTNEDLIPLEDQDLKTHGTGNNFLMQPENFNPSWSPDGTKLAYSVKTKGIRQIWVYDFETQKETQLTFGPEDKGNPCWAPNSLDLAFNATDGLTSELYVININQPDAKKITRRSEEKHLAQDSP